MPARVPQVPPRAATVSPPARVEPTTVELLRDAVGETRELVRIELALVRAELTLEVERARRAAVAFALAVASLVMVLCLLAMTLVLAVGATAYVSLAIAAAVLTIGIVATVTGYALLPKRPLARTRERWENGASELKELKERIA